MALAGSRVVEGSRRAMTKFRSFVKKQKCPTTGTGHEPKPFSNVAAVVVKPVIVNFYLLRINSIYFTCGSAPVEGDEAGREAGNWRTRLAFAILP